MIYISPQSGAAPVVQFIERAQGQLGIEVYYFTSKPILRAIHDAVRRGVATFVIVDGRPYRMSRKRVRKEITGIAATGAKVKIAPARSEGRAALITRNTRSPRALRSSAPPNGTGARFTGTAPCPLSARRTFPARA